LTFPELSRENEYGMEAQELPPALPVVELTNVLLRATSDPAGESPSPRW
jgi:hypothetical protein